MDIKPLTPDYAVSPQITPDDVAAVKAAGYVTIICNRPDGEIPREVQSAQVAAAAESAGLAFIDNPVFPGAMTQQNLDLQGQAITEAGGPVFAYCASGNRSSIVWSLLNVATLGVDGVLAATTAAGYDHQPLRGQLEHFANS